MALVLLPFAPGILVFTLGTTFETGSEVPLIALLATSAMSLGFISAVFFGVYALNAHAAKKLDAEIRALDTAILK